MFFAVLINFGIGLVLLLGRTEKMGSVIFFTLGIIMISIMKVICDIDDLKSELNKKSKD